MARISSCTAILKKCKTWDDFRSQADQLGTKSKGDCFELLVKHYLQLEPKYATHLKSVWLLDEIPTKVRRHLRLPLSDEGIDLVAQTRAGEYWAIQAKYRHNESKSLTRKELSTFTDLAFAVCANFDLSLVCTTTERFSRKLKLHGDRLTFCAADTWRELDSEFFKRLHAALSKKDFALKPFEPRPHQQEAIDAAHGHFKVKRKRRGKLIHPCGSGKSLTAFWITQQLEAKKTVVAVPSLSLLKQTLEVWARESLVSDEECNWICVCSDQTVSDVSGDVAVLTQDLGVDVHTDPGEITAWLRKRLSGPKVVFTTYQSGRALANAAKAANASFDVGIFDEAHKTVGAKNAMFSHLLFDENIEIRKRVFMTATERRYRGRSDDVLSMDDAKVYGDTFNRLSFKAAISTRPKILCDYRVMSICVTKSEIESLVKRNAFLHPKNWDREVEATRLASAVALRKAMEKHAIGHAVSFHSTIKAASNFQDIHRRLEPEFGELNVFHVSGAMPTARRARCIRDFASAQTALMTNARCLTEGVDVPLIDCVLFADPKKSTVDIVQAVGRALRPAKGKKHGYVIVPVFIDETKGEDAVEQAFQPIINVLRALASNDERIIEYFRAVSTGKTRLPTRDLIEIDVPVGIRIDIQDFREAVEFRVWKRLAKLSWRPFEEARAYVRRLGLRSHKEWHKYCLGELASEGGTKPADIPANPNKSYRNTGWHGWGDWLGTGRVANQHRAFRSFTQAREFVHSLQLRNNQEWRMYCKGKLVKEKGLKPHDIPAGPSRAYKNEGWVGFGDWLGTDAVSSRSREYRSFERARAFVRRLELRSGKEWEKYCDGELEKEKGVKPNDIPAKPSDVYAGRGWKGMGDWLGTGRVANQHRAFRSFEYARAFVRKLGLKNQKDWWQYCKGELAHEKGLKPDSIPRNAHGTYKDKGWKGFGDWLGTGTIAPRDRKYRNFEQARNFVRGLGLKNNHEWRQFCKGELVVEKGVKPKEIPATPETAYKNKGWQGWGDWLGTGAVAARDREYRNFEHARGFVRKLNLAGRPEWRRYCKGELLKQHGSRPDDIPAAPDQIYKNKGWKGYSDWLGTG